MRERERFKGQQVNNLDNWVPKSALGKKVKTGEVKDIDNLMNTGVRIKEPEIVDTLMPDSESDLILIGQAKGKFGGGKRRAFKQNQKKTEDGNKTSFRSMAVVGNKNSIVGIGSGRSNETVPAREKASLDAKKNIFKIRLGCGSWECGCGGNHSIPYSVSGKCGSVRIKLMPAPKGVGLCIHPECQKVLRLAGVKDVWSMTSGTTSTTQNLIYALVDALRKLSTMRLRQ